MTNEKLRTGQKVKIMTSSKGLQRAVITGSVRGFGNEQLITIDQTLIDLAYLEIKEATYIFDVLSDTAKNLALDEEYTPEVKKKLKNDLNFTSKAVQYLTRAQEGYKTMMKSLEQVEAELDKRVKSAEYYEMGIANMLQKLQYDVVIMTLLDDNEENDRKITNYLQKFKWPEDLKRCVETIRRNRNRFISKTK